MIDVSLRSGSKGRFEVRLDDQLIFSKLKSRRFPNRGEIVTLSEPVLGPPIAWR